MLFLTFSAPAHCGRFNKITRVFTEFRGMIGDRLFNQPHEPWLLRRRTLPPVFTKEQIRLSGGHITEPTEEAECRTLTLRAFGALVVGSRFDRPRRR